MTSVATDTAKKVLVVDDDGAIMKLIDYVLKRQGYKPITATYWTDALDALTHGSPDLILLDLSMPTVDGCCVLEFIPDRDNRVPVIISIGPHRRGHCREAGRIRRGGLRLETVPGRGSHG